MTAIYRMYGFYRVQILGMFAVFGLVSVGLLVAVAVGAKGGPPVGFSLLWVAAVCWNGYWFLFRLVYRLDLQDDVLHWQTPIRSGVIPLADLVEMRPYRLSGQIELLRTRRGQAVMVWARKGFTDFTQEIQAAAPHVSIRLSRIVRLSERMPGPRGYKP